MIEYRSFRNLDPPKLLALWHQSGLGRGAAEGITCDAFDALLFSQPYFDPRGLIFAWHDNELVGMVHAGFGVNSQRSQLDHDKGVICAVLVHPAHRRRGIGRELVRRAEEYLTSAGTTRFFAGPAPGLDPFYFGLYGGSQPSGFLESDPTAALFFEAIGYQPIQRREVLQRDLSSGGDPVTMRLVALRRQTQLAHLAEPHNVTWWWLTRFGRLESLRFLLTRKSDHTTLAAMTVLGLDLYVTKWQARAVGLTDLYVSENERRNGYGQALVVETCRRLRQEQVTLVDSQTLEDNHAYRNLLKSVGFEKVDTGVLYRRPPA